MTYRAELSGRALKQMHGLPGPAFDSLIEVMAEVIDYPDDPLRTFLTSDPYVRRVEFGDAGLITYLINDGADVVIVLDITWAEQSQERAARQQHDVDEATGICADRSAALRRGLGQADQDIETQVSPGPIAARSYPNVNQGLWSLEHRNDPG